MFEKVIVIDGFGHLIGRLASTIAKQLLNGQKIVVVRTEEINISGSLFRNKLKYACFMRKRTATNPTRGHWHFRAPSRILWRVIRGMIPHKTKRGAAALERLKVFEGVPHPFNKVKRVVVPGALKTIRLKPGRRFCKLGDLANGVGWKHQNLVSSLEAKRKLSSSAYYQTKKELLKLRAKAIINKKSELSKLEKPLSSFGHAVA